MRAPRAKRRLFAGPSVAYSPRAKRRLFASTIERALAGIAWAQRSCGHEWFRAHPAIAAVMNGIRRQNGTAPTQKAPVVDLELAIFVATLDDSLRGLRDRALLTMGWFGAFRRSELVASTSPT